MVKDYGSVLKTLFTLLSIIGIIAVSCGILESEGETWPPSFDRVEEIMQKSCMACHSAETLDTLVEEVYALKEKPELIDSTPTLYSRQLVLDEIASLGSKILQYPQLDFTDSMSLHHYTNNILGKREVICQRLQFKHFRPYYPRAMPPPYTKPLKKSLSDHLDPYLAALSHPDSMLGTWKTFDTTQNLVLTIGTGGWLSHTFSQYDWYYREDSIFSDDGFGGEILVGVLDLRRDTLFWDDKLPSDNDLEYYKITPLQAIAQFVSQWDIGNNVNNDAWWNYGIYPLTQAECAYCHNKSKNFTAKGSPYDIKQAPLYKRILNLKQASFAVNIQHNPHGISRQLQSLGNRMMYHPEVNFAQAGNIETFMNIDYKAEDMAQRVQAPIYHDWYSGGMPPPWTRDILQAVDPSNSRYAFEYLKDKERKTLLAFLESRLSVSAFVFQGLAPDEYACCDDVGLPFRTAGYWQIQDCRLTPYFQDEEADSIFKANNNN